VARALADRRAGTAYELEARCYLGLSLLGTGDPAGFEPFAAMQELAVARPELSPITVRMAVLVYAAAVRSLFNAAAGRVRAWMTEGMQRHHLEWAADVVPYQMLELVQRGEYAAALAHLDTAAIPPRHSTPHTVLVLARVLYEARAGSAGRAHARLAAAQPSDDFAHTALLDLARLELESGVEGGASAQPPADIYARAESRRFVRLAGAAAVALARTGDGAPARPDWLAAAAPLGVFWDWAAGIATRDATALRAVAARLEEMTCPYEAALALRDAGDLQEAYRALRALGATGAREQVARLLRAADRPIPRGPRARADSTELTDTERAVCRLVIGGATNETVAAQLNIGIRTVEAHLSRIYQKTGQSGRIALVNWWRDRAL